MNTGRLPIMYKYLIESSSPRLNAAKDSASWQHPSLQTARPLQHCTVLPKVTKKSLPAPWCIDYVHVDDLGICPSTMPQSGVSLAEDNAVATRSICGRGYYRSKDCRRGHQNAETTFFFLCRPLSSPFISSARHLSVLSRKQQQPVKQRLCVAYDEC